MGADTPPRRDATGGREAVPSRGASNPPPAPDVPDGDRHHDRLGPIGGGQDIYTGVISRLLSGPLVFGLIGLGLDRWLSTRFFLPAGLIGGMVLAIYVIWLRYGTAVAPGTPGGRPTTPHEEQQ